jgi:hypothetical protein
VLRLRCARGSAWTPAPTGRESRVVPTRISAVARRKPRLGATYGAGRAPNCNRIRGQPASPVTPADLLDPRSSTGTPSTGSIDPFALRTKPISFPTRIGDTQRIPVQDITRTIGDSDECSPFDRYDRSSQRSRHSANPGFGHSFPGYPELAQPSFAPAAGHDAVDGSSAHLPWMTRAGYPAEPPQAECRPARTERAGRIGTGGSVSSLRRHAVHRPRVDRPPSRGDDVTVRQR